MLNKVVKVKNPKVDWRTNKKWVVKKSLTSNDITVVRLVSLTQVDDNKWVTEKLVTTTDELVIVS